MKYFLCYVSLAFLIFILGLYFQWTNINIEYVISEYKHHAVHLPYIVGVLVGLLGNGVTLIFDVIVEIIKHIK
jgi:hypothetical protein